MSSKVKVKVRFCTPAGDYEPYTNFRVSRAGPPRRRARPPPARA